MNLQFL